MAFGDPVRYFSYPSRHGLSPIFGAHHVQTTHCVIFTYTANPDPVR